jgi:hypothetical protein
VIADGGTINCSRKCHSNKLNMWEYLLDSPMIAIEMGDANVVIGVQWLQSLGTVIAQVVGWENPDPTIKW